MLRASSGTHANSNNLRAVLLDTQGPEIRTGFFPLPRKTIEVEIDQEFDLSVDPADERNQSEKMLYINYKNIGKILKVGDPILLGDGLIQLEVIFNEAGGSTPLRAKALNAGTLGNRKGVNLPGAIVDLPALTQKDRADIKWGIENEVDFIAASFVRKAEDVRVIRAYVDECHSAALAHNGWASTYPKVQIISKIENGEALDNFAEILQESDGIMVARGDLGVEIPFQNVTPAQKRIVRACNEAGKPVIVATQMLESMTQNPRPTRAEASDVANAVEDGADAVMLSGETANGKYPIQAVRAMHSIVDEADRSMEFVRLRTSVKMRPGMYVGREASAVAQAAVSLAHAVDAALIVVVATTGSTARAVSRHRPNMPIVTLCESQRVARQLQLNKGVYTLSDDDTHNYSQRPTLAVIRAKERGWCKSGDTIVMVWASEGSKEIGKVSSVHVATVN